MNEKQGEFYVPPGGPPRVAPPSHEIFPAMGVAGVQQMIADFYGELVQSEIQWMFPDDVTESVERSAAFFVGLLGGPPLYHQRYGNPMMRARHNPFPINEASRQVWLACFERVLADAPAKYGFPAEHVPGFWAFLQAFSTWMVNRK